MINRSFTIIDYPDNGETFGRYMSKSPKRAAHKAFSTLSRKIDLKNSNHKKLLVFTIKETTQNSRNKEYKYVGTRVELAKPIIRVRDGKQIMYKYKNILTSYNDFVSD